MRRLRTRFSNPAELATNRPGQSQRHEQDRTRRPGSAEDGEGRSGADGWAWRRGGAAPADWAFPNEPGISSGSLKVRLFLELPGAAGSLERVASFGSSTSTSPCSRRLFSQLSNNTSPAAATGSPECAERLYPTRERFLPARTAAQACCGSILPSVVGEISIPCRNRSSMKRRISSR